MPTYLVKQNVGALCVSGPYKAGMEMKDRIRRARKAAGLTQMQVAKALGIDRVSVTQWEGGQTKPDIDRLPAVADILKTTVPWLLSGNGDSPPLAGADTRLVSAPPARLELIRKAFAPGLPQALGLTAAEWRELAEQPAISDHGVVFRIREITGLPAGYIAFGETDSLSRDALVKLLDGLNS